MENTLENKAAFFALYWGQKIINRRLDFESGKFKTFEDSLSVVKGSTIDTLDFFTSNVLYQKDPTVKATDYLELRSIESLTVQELKQMRKDLNFDINGFDNQARIKDWIESFRFNNLLGGQDIMIRFFFWFVKNGFAVPIGDLTVETLIQWDWVKLKEV